GIGLGNAPRSELDIRLAGDFLLRNWAGTCHPNHEPAGFRIKSGQASGLVEPGELLVDRRSRSLSVLRGCAPTLGPQLRFVIRRGRAADSCVRWLGRSLVPHAVSGVGKCGRSASGIVAEPLG